LLTDLQTFYRNQLKNVRYFLPVYGAVRESGQVEDADGCLVRVCEVLQIARTHTRQLTSLPVRQWTMID